MKKAIKRILYWIDKIESILTIYLLGSIVVLLTIQVTRRYLFNSPLTWAEELSMLQMIYLCFFSADIAYRRKGHINIDFFVNLFNRKLKRIVEIIINTIILIFLVNMFKESIILIRLQIRTKFVAALPFTKSFWILPVAIVFLSMSITTFYFILYHNSLNELK